MRIPRALVEVARAVVPPRVETINLGVDDPEGVDDPRTRAHAARAFRLAHMCRTEKLRDVPHVAVPPAPREIAAHDHGLVRRRGRREVVAKPPYHESLSS